MSTKIIDLKIKRQIKQNLNELGYENLTNIQEKTIDLILNNQNVFGLARTGSGKTAAFLVPIINHLSINKKAKALVIAPTRDLADQIFNNNVKYAKKTGIRSTKLVGGIKCDIQIKFLEDNPRIIIATPGRIIDLFKRNALSLDDIQYLVLDEADQMLDMGFINDIKFIISKMNSRVQTSLFSATATKEILELVKDIMDEYKLVEVEEQKTIKDSIKQLAYIVTYKNKLNLLLDIIGNSKRTLQQAIIFTRTKKEASELASFLKYKKYTVEDLHSDRSMQSRIRVLKMFRNNEIQILVATDVAARGIDISNLPLVINFQLPEQKEIYVHRIGRTGRAGKDGEAITFFEPNEKYLIKDFEKITNSKIEVINDSNYTSNNPDAPVLKIQRKKPSHIKHSNNVKQRKENNKFKNNKKTFKTKKRK